MIKVILNCLPPARIDTPSAGLAVLKAFLVRNGVDSEVLYWNILLGGILPPFERNTDAIHLELLPYLYLMAGQYGDDIAWSKTNAFMKAELPLRDILNDNSDYLSGAGRLLHEVVESRLSRYLPHERLLFGISCKYEQWIPGMVLGRYIKDRFPRAGIVIGGLRDRDRAASIMKICELFDFAIWGEGEYPLLELCRTLDGEDTDLALVPRLAYRKDGALRFSDIEKGKFLDMNSRVFSDHDDYFACLEASGRKDVPVILPLESSRGCTWNACRFCVYSDGYENRKKDPEVLAEEIHYLLDRHDTPRFAFMDNDIVANDHGRLERILDDLISIREHRDVQFIAEVIHKGFTAELMEKLPRAGFGRIHFGYESLSDPLLSKMKKRTDFSDNIFFVKFARKFGIVLPSANVICSVIGEEDLDILQCIDNLHFLRFYFDRDLFHHTIIPLRIANHSEFHRMVPTEELARWDGNEIFHLLPDEIKRSVDRFCLFDFFRAPNALWGLFSKMNDFYYSHTYTYSITRQGESMVYKEFFDSRPVLELVIGPLAYRILEEANRTIADLPALVEALKARDGTADRDAVCAALDTLRERHLIYFRDDYRSIISVIDTDQVA